MLEPNDVEATVLSCLSLSISMGLNGALCIEADGRGEAVSTVIAQASNPSFDTIDEIISRTINSDLLPLDDDLRDDVLILRQRLKAALDMVDAVLQGNN